ncbi:hypothetical protein MKY84_01315 [Chryseomicrobium sp. FSL W7-1435]|uniref:hypothetical protein n=1 Tax=Chryseomicrobium sp. FSL W7-1435 TaxID=2921704 RepID=UPI00315A45E0
MKKAQQMDQLLAGQEVTEETVLHAVHQVFGFDLNKVPFLKPTQQTAREVIQAKLASQETPVTGAEIRKFINELFGVNLEALSALEGAGLSLYAKERWVIEQATDYFVIYSENSDRVARVFTTSHYAQNMGTSSAPPALTQALHVMGYTSDTTDSSFYFQSEGPLPDAFKGQTISAVLQNMPEVYS